MVNIVMIDPIPADYIPILRTTAQITTSGSHPHPKQFNKLAKKLTQNIGHARQDLFQSTNRNNRQFIGIALGKIQMIAKRLV